VAGLLDRAEALHLDELAETAPFGIARLQLALLADGLIDSSVAKRREQLTELLREEDLEIFADRYLELIGEAFSIDFPSALAA